MKGILLDVIRVKPRADYCLELEFENGERRLFDMKPLLSKKPFDRLKREGVFMSAHVHLGTVAWVEEIDIAPETLYEQSVAMTEAAKMTEGRRERRSLKKDTRLI